MTPLLGDSPNLPAKITADPSYQFDNHALAWRDSSGGHAQEATSAVYEHLYYTQNNLQPFISGVAFFLLNSPAFFFFFLLELSECSLTDYIAEHNDKNVFLTQGKITHVKLILL